ncbi:major facilitator transporter [Pseudonocardia sp. EC080610-09]|uniref:MFS transporter n=1 Tax=unclassified Pseudonocardia TaxID=2619320 RepID=UPI0006CB36DA|nr:MULTISPECIES: MFS transporter [unclassified Pseudonocardia]ALE73098.1 major facilitator transporter [Pseudonocardia sp. EC080625-04]ALL76417.1 major facilitator transporter [Pseudonocardia sp. EC080610-09]ALL83444.1 major facilitator transporter [Pseudonocardia sp. EC080619-01]
MSTRDSERTDRRRTILGIGTGNAMEWFDWNVYATFSAFFAPQFFAGDDPGAALLKTLAVFAVGFVARPFGGWVFGAIADRRGRKLSMALCVATAAVGSLVIGLTPTYATIGLAAPLVLLVARLAQGLAHGGELPAAQTYLAEMAPRQRRGLWSSLIYVSGTVGILAGTVLGAVLAGTLTAGQMASWGWRVPFLLGGVFGLYALVMRLRMRESDTYVEESSREAGTTGGPSLLRRVFSRPKALARVVFLTSGITVVYYVWSVAAPAYAITARGVAPAASLWAGAAALTIFMLLLPAWGAASDRFGRRRTLLVPGALLVVLLFPLDAMISDGPTLFVAMTVALVLIGAPCAIAPALYAELFPTGIRAAGLGVPYSVSVALFGGTAPYLQTLFAEIGRPGLFLAYSAGLLVVSGVAVYLLPETRGIDLASAGAEEPAEATR